MGSNREKSNNAIAILEKLSFLKGNKNDFAIVGRAITIWEAIQKRSHEPIYKTIQKLKQRD